MPQPLSVTMRMLVIIAVSPPCRIPDSAFIDLALARNALRFGSFKLKSGRESPYFFNAGLFSDGAAAAVLGQCYAAALLRSGLEFDVLFGPAYKGIPLVDGHGDGARRASRPQRALRVQSQGAKDHGEGGNVVGAPLRGRVVIVDDVITAGTAIRESIDMIRGAGGATGGRRAGAGPAGTRPGSAVRPCRSWKPAWPQDCVSVITLADLIEALSSAQAGRQAFLTDQLTALRPIGSGTASSETCGAGASVRI